MGSWVSVAWKLTNWNWIFFFKWKEKPSSLWDFFFFYYLIRAYLILTNNTHAMLFLILVSLLWHGAIWNAFLIFHTAVKCYYLRSLLCVLISGFSDWMDLGTSKRKWEGRTRSTFGREDLFNAHDDFENRIPSRDMRLKLMREARSR